MRIAIVGCSGSGKTTLARRVAERTGARHIEIDAFHHLPGWEPKDRGLLRHEIAEQLSRRSWVCDGNYQSMVGDLVQAAADTIVLYDLPRRQVLRQVVFRTIRRAVTREELWNGNREPLSNFTRWSPEKNIIRWSWVKHPEYRAGYRAQIDAGEWDHAQVVVITSHADADAWLATLPRPPE